MRAALRRGYASRHYVVQVRRHDQRSLTIRSHGRRILLMQAVAVSPPMSEPVAGESPCIAPARRPAAAARRRLTVALAWLALALVWFVSLGHRALINPDEGRYATIALGVLQSGDWITPHLNGFVYFEKPPLGYWAVAAAMQVFGVGEFAARLAPATSGFATVVAVAFTAQRLWDARAGVLAGAVATGTVWIVANAHFLSLDMGLTFFLTLALCAFVLAQRDDASAREHRWWMHTAWAAMGCATLTKGLAGVLIPGATLLLYVAWTRQWTLLRRLHPTAGVALYAAIVVPWFIAVSLRNPGFLDFFFVHEHLQRYLTDTARRPGAPWYFLPILLVGFLPWTTMLPALARFGARADARRRFQPQRLLLAWAVFVFVFFSASRSKLPSYILPMFPALALLAGPWLAAAAPQRLRVHLVAPVAAALVLLAATPFFARFATPDTPPETLEAMAPGFAAAAVLVVGGALLAWHALGRNHTTQAVVVLGAAGVVAVLAALDGHDEHASIKSSRNVAQVLAAHLPRDAPVFSVAMYDQTLPFYLRRDVTLVAWTDEFAFGQRREPQRWIPDIDAFIARWSELPRAGAMMRIDTWQSLAAAGLPMRVVYRDSRRVVVVRTSNQDLEP